MKKIIDYKIIKMKMKLKLGKIKINVAMAEEFNECNYQDGECKFEENTAAPE